MNTGAVLGSRARGGAIPSGRRLNCINVAVGAAGPPRRRRADSPRGIPVSTWTVVLAAAAPAFKLRKVEAETENCEEMMLSCWIRWALAVSWRSFRSLFCSFRAVIGGTRARAPAYSGTSIIQVQVPKLADALKQHSKVLRLVRAPDNDEVVGFVLVAKGDNDEAALEGRAPNLAYEGLGLPGQTS